MHAKLRVARSTGNLPEILRFYRDGLGLTPLASFEDHDGFDGVMLGHPGLPYHLEFTRRHGHAGVRAPDQESLLVFYLPEAGEWQRAVDRMRETGFPPVASLNPYWDRDGATFEDVDGYRVVLQNATWTR